MKNRRSEPLLILLFSSILLSIFSFIPIKIWNYDLPDYLSELKPKLKKSFSHPEQQKYAGKQDTSFLEPSQMLADTTVNSFGDLTKFFEALYALQQNPQAVHIAYYGDSMIEGDLITMDLRSMFQKKFGGKGVGYMPITSATAGFRSTIKHQFNELWTTFNYNEKPPNNKELCWSGYCFKGNPGATVMFKKAKGHPPFNAVKTYCKSNLKSSLRVKTGEKSISIEIPEADSIQTIEIHDSLDFDQLEIEVAEGNPEFYGLNFENGSGLYIDNYSFRGNSGIPLSSINEEMYSFASNKMNCKLVILHYGLNVVGHDSKDYSWYLTPFRKTIRKIKSAFPNATIVLASVGDKSYKFGTQYHTEPDIPLFVGMQVKLAREENIVFWNMYKAMGGYDSMKRWVEESPKRAGKDYTHINHQGAKEIATLFYNWMMDEYNKFLRNKLESIVKIETASPKIDMP